jgi:hypothetical protein
VKLTKIVFQHRWERSSAAVSIRLEQKLSPAAWSLRAKVLLGHQDGGPYALAHWFSFSTINPGPVNRDMTMDIPSPGTEKLPSEGGPCRGGPYASTLRPNSFIPAWLHVAYQCRSTDWSTAVYVEYPSAEGSHHNPCSVDIDHAVDGELLFPCVYLYIMCGLVKVNLFLQLSNWANIITWFAIARDSGLAATIDCFGERLLHILVDGAR